MKKAKWFATVLVVASIILCSVGCKGKVADGFVYVKGATVTGALPPWLDELDENRYRGVFVEGRTVTLSDFYMGKYEVTQEEYASVMKGQKVTVAGVEYELESNPNYCTKESTSYTLFEGEKQEKRPVEGVTWYDAVWYCNALSAKEVLRRVLPASSAVVLGITKVRFLAVSTTTRITATATVGSVLCVPVLETKKIHPVFF